MTGELLGAKSDGHDFRAERSAMREADDSIVPRTPRGGTEIRGGRKLKRTANQPSRRDFAAETRDRRER